MENTRTDVSMSRVNGRPVRKVHPIALLVMHETEHVLMNTWKLPLVCVQLSPAPSPWKKKQSAFVNARVVAHRVKNKKFYFHQSWPSLFSSNGEMKQFGLWLTSRAKLTNQKHCLRAKEFPKRKTTLSQQNFYGSPTTLTFLLTVIYTLGTNFFLPPSLLLL